MHSLTGNTDLTEVNQSIEAKRGVVQALWQDFQAKKDAAVTAGDPVGSPRFKSADVAYKNYEAIASELQDLEGKRELIFKGLAESKSNDGTDPNSLAGRIVRGDGYKALVQSRALESENSRFGSVKLAHLDQVETKALVTGLSDTSAGAFITNQRAGYVMETQRAPSILNLVTMGTTNVDAIEYARQGPFVNAAAETAEATSLADGLKPETGLAFVKVTETVRTFAHWLQTTRRAVADAGEMKRVIGDELVYGLQLRLENQIVNGNGVGENMTGILNTSGILTQAKGADTVVDAIHKGITQIRLGFNQPNGVALHPTDWQSIRLAKDTQGDYYYGAPGEAGGQTIFGLPAIVTTAIPVGTGLVGDFSKYAVWMRSGAEVLVSDSHGDTFTRNILTFLAELRLAASVTLPAGFCRVTGL